MEILKQKQYSPISVENQIMIIYAAINGYLNDIELERIASFEDSLYEFMAMKYPEISQEIVATGNMSAETEKLLIQGIEECKKEGKYIA